MRAFVIGSSWTDSILYVQYSRSRRFRLGGLRIDLPTDYSTAVNKACISLQTLVFFLVLRHKQGETYMGSVSSYLCEGHSTVLCMFLTLISIQPPFGDHLATSAWHVTCERRRHRHQQQWVSIFDLLYYRIHHYLLGLGKKQPAELCNYKDCTVPHATRSARIVYPMMP